MSKVAKLSAVFGLVITLSLTSAVWAQKVNVAVYNPDADGGKALGEEGIMKCLKSADNLQADFVTDLSRNQLRKYKVLVLPLITKFGDKAKAADWRWEVINYVHGGGRILLTSDNTGIRGEVRDSLFPTIMEGHKTVWSKTVGPISVYSVNKGVEPFRIRYRFQTELRRGSKGVVFLRNGRWGNVGIVGDYGKGKVLALGFPLGVASEGRRQKQRYSGNREVVLQGLEARLLLNAVGWLAGEEKYEIPNVWIDARRLKPLNKGPSRILDAGAEGGPIRLKAGAAAVDITPPNPVGKTGILSGLGRGRLKCKGVHDRLMLRALVLDNGKTKAAIIAIDKIRTFGRDTSRRIRKAIKDKTGIPESSILINCTHSHSSTNSGGVDLPAKAIEAVCLANSRLRKARLGAGSKMIYGICANIRERWHDDYRGLWGNQQPNPDGVMDNECGVIRVEDDNRKLIAIVVNYTGTPSSAGGTPYISGDYAGIATHHLEKKFGCTAMFLQGFQGNVFTSAFRINRTIKDAERLGRKLADEVISIVPHIDVKSQIKLAASHKYIPLPTNKGAVETETQTLLIGDCLLIFSELEVYVEIGMRLKQTLSKRFSHVFCCGVGRLCGKYLSWRRGFGVEHRTADARKEAYSKDAEGVMVKNFLKMAAEAEKAE